MIPGGKLILPRQVTGGTNSAHYCYEVWMKHLTMLWEHGLHTIPHTLAELGPGDSLGIGLSAILSGVNRYYALDVVKYSNTDFNLRIFDELVELFRNRAAGPHNGWPDYSRHLDEGRFPSHILTDEVLEHALSKERLEMIRDEIASPGSSSDIRIVYMVPWTDEYVIDAGTVDVIISHSVLEHVVDLDATYRALNHWLREDGLMSHQIDFTSHGLSETWNGYRAYPEFLWKLIAGKHTYLINRQPYSVHRRLIEKYGFQMTCELKHYRPEPGVERSKLASRWAQLTDDDLRCSGAFIQAKKVENVSNSNTDATLDEQ